MKIDIQIEPNISEFLELIDQEKVMEHYLGIPVEYGVSVVSPLHEDTDPSAGFLPVTEKYKNLLFKDFRGLFSGNVLDVIKFKYNVNTIGAINMIKSDFKNTDYKRITGIKDKERSIIQIKAQKYTNVDISYWLQYGITKNTLELYRVYSCKHIWLNSKYPSFTYRTDNPIYGYYFTKKEWKIYFPLQKRYRFLSNTNCLQGYNQLPDYGDLLVYTKSLKECMLLHELNIPAIASQAENQILSEKQFEELSLRFNTIICNMDYDRAGIKVMVNMRRKYGVQCITFTDSLSNKTKDAKDLSDYCKKYGIEKTKKLIYSINII